MANAWLKSFETLSEYQEYLTKTGNRLVTELDALKREFDGLLWSDNVRERTRDELNEHVMEVNRFVEQLEEFIVALDKMQEQIEQYKQC